VAISDLLLHVDHFTNHVIDSAASLQLHVELFAQNDHVDLGLNCILACLLHLLDWG